MSNYNKGFSKNVLNSSEGSESFSFYDLWKKLRQTLVSLLSGFS